MKLKLLKYPKPLSERDLSPETLRKLLEKVRKQIRHEKQEQEDAIKN